VRRRDFIALLGGAAAWPLKAKAQQGAMPVIGFVNSQSPEGYTERLRGFRQGLKEAGYVEGENAAIDYRWAENRIDRLPELAGELARRQVAVIAATGSASAAFAAKAATTTIPIVFISAEDPVRLGLVGSIARPSGNVTGINIFSAELNSKGLDLLRTLVPVATRVAVLVNPANAVNAEPTLRDVQSAAGAMGLHIQVLEASTSREINAAFASLGRERPDPLFVGPDIFFLSRRLQLAHLATRHAIPATYSARPYAEAGGLMSYGASLKDAYRQVGLYAGRILRGAKASDLPVVRPTKLEFVVNLKTAIALGLTVPASMQLLADEVIE
jgi:putative tryptophan/tyrosine transport system substrate-binding protein